MFVMIRRAQVCSSLDTFRVCKYEVLPLRQVSLELYKQIDHNFDIQHFQQRTFLILVLRL